MPRLSKLPDPHKVNIKHERLDLDLGVCVVYLRSCHRDSIELEFVEAAAAAVDERFHDVIVVKPSTLTPASSSQLIISRHKIYPYRWLKRFEANRPVMASYHEKELAAHLRRETGQSDFTVLAIGLHYEYEVDGRVLTHSTGPMPYLALIGPDEQVAAAKRWAMRGGFKKVAQECDARARALSARERGTTP